MIKKITKSELVAIIMLLLVAIFVRFYDYPHRLIFGPEQSMSLITTGEYIKEKFTLLGEPYIQRLTSNSHFLFHSALFNYLLIPLEILFNYQPFPITVSFAVLNLITGILIYFLVRKEMGHLSAWFSTFLFLLNSKMIHHSLFIWSLNLLPLVGLLSILYLYKLFKDRQSLLPIFILGLLSGIGLGLQYVFLFSLLVVFFLNVIFSQKKFSSIYLFALGVAVGISPMILFDLKHDFFHLRILYQYFLDIQTGLVTGFYTYYQFLNLWPLFAILGGIILSFIWKFNKFIVVLLLSCYVFFQIVSPFSRLTSGKITDHDITLKDLKHISMVVSADKPPVKFNVAMLLDFDTRAHPLRYMLTFRHNLKPQAVTNYNNIDALYVLAPKEYDILNPSVWELKTYLPYKIKILDRPTNNHLLYKITK